MIHIAILDVDVPVPTVYAARGLYSSQFRSLLQSAGARLGLPSSCIYTTAFDVVGGSLPHLRSLRTSPPVPTTETDEDGKCSPLSLPIDGILITGAAAAAYEPTIYPWIVPLTSFIQTVFNEYPHVKMFGSCFGHQIIGQALLSSQSPTSASENEVGSVVVQACPRGSEVGLTSITLNSDFSAHFPGPCGSLPVKNQMRLQMIHGDWVALLPGTERLPAPWMNVGATELCPLQGLYYPGKVLTYQGHFEFDVFVNRETCLEFGRRSNWDPSDVERYLGLIEKGRVAGKEGDEDDSKAAAEAVVLFFRG